MLFNWWDPLRPPPYHEELPTPLYLEWTKDNSHALEMILHIGMESAPDPYTC